MGEHHYALEVRWTGNRGGGTTGYRDYDRAVTLVAEGKPDLLGSADPAFRGDATRWNPEELLLAALAQCHLLSYLHVAVRHGVVVTAYRDEPLATMTQEGLGGHLTRALLRPVVTVASRDQVELAAGLHAEARRDCFIAASVTFPVDHEPTTEVAR